MRLLLQLVRWIWGLQTTVAGRANITGMVLALIGSGLISLLSIFEAVVRVFKPHYSTGQLWLQLFIVFCIFELLCVVILAVLELASPGDGPSF